MLNKKLFLLIFILLFGQQAHSMEGQADQGELGQPLQIPGNGQEQPIVQIDGEGYDDGREKENDQEQPKDVFEDANDELNFFGITTEHLSGLNQEQDVTNNNLPTGDQVGQNVPQVQNLGNNQPQNQPVQQPLQQLVNANNQQVQAGQNNQPPVQAAPSVGNQVNGPQVQNLGNNQPQNQPVQQLPQQLINANNQQVQAGQNNQPPVQAAPAAGNQVNVPQVQNLGNNPPQAPQQQVPVQPIDTRGKLDILDQNIDDGIDWIDDNRWKSLIGSVLGGLVLYKIFEKPIKARATEFKDFCEGKFFDALMKWEKIKEEGLTKLDYIKGIVALLAAGSLGGATYYYGIDTSKKQIEEFFHLLRVYKIELGEAVLGLAAGRWLYQIKVSLDNRKSRVLNFDKFLGQLTEEQRRIIFNSEDLLVAIGKGGDNHKRLLENEEFMELLTDKQKTYLQNIVTYRCSAVRNVL